MRSSLSFNPALQRLPVYQPGRPIKEVAREIGLSADSIIKLASNENPLGPSPAALAAMENVLKHLHIYWMIWVYVVALFFHVAFEDVNLPAVAGWILDPDLVLQGVIDVDDLDRAVSLGPALGWAAAGPHLTYHLAAGDEGVTVFLQQLLGSFEGWWAQLPTWHKLEPEQQRALIQSIERAYRGKIPELREARDRRLSAILRALEQSRTT